MKADFWCVPQVKIFRQLVTDKPDGCRESLHRLPGFLVRAFNAHVDAHALVAGRQSHFSYRYESDTRVAKLSGQDSYQFFAQGFVQTLPAMLLSAWFQFL